ncbi:MAG TPA: hypothetical protein VG778_06555 [Blastocatellia bacterium]|nr:hypothetical protein [Blastocatellia bacterium]
MSDSATFPLALELKAGTASLGSVFSFLSAIYFRGKLAYAEVFKNPPEGVPGALVITPAAGLQVPEETIGLEQLKSFASVEVSEKNSTFREPVESDANRIARLVSDQCEVVLLGSIATNKYLSVLTDAFGPRLRFPAEFVGRGDMSRGGLMLRCVADSAELTYTGCETTRRGPRPPKLQKLPARRPS